MHKAFFLLFLSLFLLKAPGIMAHSINFETGQQYPVIWVKSFFSRTSPVAGAKVEVFAPGSSQPYQIGRTDQEGFFAFMPVSAGDWIFAVDDERGHRDRIIVNVGQSFFDADTPTGVTDDYIETVEESESFVKDIGNAKIPLTYRIIFGIALIFGITGTFYGIKAIQALKKNN